MAHRERLRTRRPRGALFRIKESHAKIDASIALLMARLCHVLAHASEATSQVQAVGLPVKVPHTKLPSQSPWLAIMNRQTEIARKLAAELALPPAQRNRAGMAVRNAVPRDDEWGF